MGTLRSTMLAATIFVFGVGAARAQITAPGNMQQQPAESAPMTSDDHAAFADAFVAGRLADVRALLKLTPEQEKLWPPLETAIRDAVKARIDIARKTAERRGAGDMKPLDPLQRLTFASDIATERAEALKKIVAAAQPLSASLSEEQKRTIAAAEKLRHFRFDVDREMLGMQGRESDRGRDRMRHPDDDERGGSNRDMRGYGGQRFGRGDEGDGSDMMRRGWQGRRDYDGRRSMEPRWNRDQTDDNGEGSGMDD